MPERVEICVQGQLDEQWSEWLGGLDITHVEPDRSLLSGPIADQTSLYGILTRLKDLGLKLVYVQLEEGVKHE